MVNMRSLEIVQLTAASSPVATQGIASAGLLDMPRAVLLSEEWGSPGAHPLAAGATSVSRAATVVGCLRLWRTCVSARVHFAALSDTFPCVLVLLSWARGVCCAPSAASHADTSAAEEFAEQPSVAAPLYVPDAAKQQTMKQQLQERASKVAVAVSPAESGEPGSEHDNAEAVAYTVFQEVALLATALLQHDIPAHATPPAWMKRSSMELQEGSTDCEPMCSPGAMQQLAPLLVDFLCSTGAAAGGAARGRYTWPAAAEWLESLASDAEASQGLREDLPARQNEDSQLQPPRPPVFMHAAQLQPPEVLRQGAVDACLLAVDALATPRSSAGLPVVADRVELLSGVMCQECFHRGAAMPSANRGGLSLLQQCLEVAGACEAAAVRAALCARAASAARRAGSDASAFAAAPPLARVCVQAARAVVSVGGSAAAASGVALAFGPWAAVRAHATHLAAAGLLRCLRMLAAVSGGALPEAFVSDPDMLDVLRALVLVPTMTTSADTARQALQIMFSPPAVAPCSAAAARAFGGVNLSVSPADAAQHLVPGPALLAAYCAAWTGSGAPVPLPSAGGADGSVAAEPVGEVLPCIWMDTASGAGQRLPAPPDWFVLAVAARIDAPSGEGAARATPSAGELSAAVLAAAVTWVAGLMHSGICDAAEVDFAPALVRGWGRKAVRACQWNCVGCAVTAQTAGVL